jgi:hypothetical protein
MGFPEAIEAVFPQAAVQTCIVHLIRKSLDFVSRKDRKPFVADLRKIYRAAAADAGRKALAAFEDSAWRKYAAIGQIWRRQWEQIIPFFAFAPAVRKIIYTTNAIEALNAKLLQAMRAIGQSPATRRRRNSSPNLAPRHPGMENAASRMGRGKNPVRHHVWRTLRQDMMKTGPRAQNSGHSRWRSRPACAPNGTVKLTRRKRRATIGSPCRRLVTHSTAATASRLR